MTESLCCTAETGATLYVNYTFLKKKNALEEIKSKTTKG